MGDRHPKKETDQRQNFMYSIRIRIRIVSFRFITFRTVQYIPSIQEPDDPPLPPPEADAFM